VARDGDYFGPVVHLASRLVELAPPGQVLVSAVVAQRIVDDGSVACEPAGTHFIRGFPEPVVTFRVVAVPTDPT
jgi:class 3 adenylate cyclase